MSNPSSESSTRIKKAAVLRVESATWAKIAKRFGYKNAESARKMMTGKYPDLWREEYEKARALHLDEIESEALLTNRELLRPLKKDGSERGERVRQSAAHSLLAHSAKLRAQKIEIAGNKGGPIAIFSNPSWMRAQGVILKALEPYPEARLAVAEALKRENNDAA